MSLRNATSLRLSLRTTAPCVLALSLGAAMPTLAQDARTSWLAANAGRLDRSTPLDQEYRGKQLLPGFLNESVMARYFERSMRASKVLFIQKSRLSPEDKQTAQRLESEFAALEQAGTAAIGCNYWKANRNQVTVFFWDKQKGTLSPWLADFGKPDMVDVAVAKCPATLGDAIDLATGARQTSSVAAPAMTLTATPVDEPTAAPAGDDEAMTAHAQKLAAQPDARAVQTLESYAASGNVLSMWLLGALLDGNHGVPKDAKRSMDLHNAAVRKDTSGIVAYFTAKSIQADTSRPAAIRSRGALSMFRESANQGFVPAFREIAAIKLIDDGYGTAPHEANAALASGLEAAKKDLAAPHPRDTPAKVAYRKAQVALYEKLVADFRPVYAQYEAARAAKKAQEQERQAAALALFAALLTPSSNSGGGQSVRSPDVYGEMQKASEQAACQSAIGMSGGVADMARAFNCR